jgi:3-oxoacyl-[acyl-carrier-protein] synthase II
MSRRMTVVVTGLGLISPVGNRRRRLGQPRGRPVGHRQCHQVRRVGALGRFAGEVKGFNVEDYFPAKEARTWTPSSITAWRRRSRRCVMRACPRAMRSTRKSAERIGVMVGSGIGGLPMIEATHEEYRNRGARRISPFFVPASIINMISGHVSIHYGFKGPNLAIVTACTTGLHCIGRRRG